MEESNLDSTTGDSGDSALCLHWRRGSDAPVELAAAAAFRLARDGFWQGLGILALCRILFGGFGHHGPGRSGARRRIKERMEERCRHMNPEEREQFRQRMREGWGFAPSAGERKEQ